MVYALVSKTNEPQSSCGFDSLPRHITLGFLAHKEFLIFIFDMFRFAFPSLLSPFHAVKPDSVASEEKIDPA